MGPYVLGNPKAEFSAESNRSLLLDLCTSQKLTIGNALFNKPAEQTITCYNVGAEKMSETTPSNFGQIDFALISKDWASKLVDVHSDRLRALASHHFVLSCFVDVTIDKCEKQNIVQRPDLA